MTKQQTIGIIVNGATGRIGSTQHLANALVPIINEGGLPLGHDRLIPRLLLVGRDGERLAEIARTHGVPEWTTDLDAALADPAWTIFFDAAATQQRVAVLAKALATGKHVYSENRSRPPPRRASPCSKKPKRAGASTARSKTRSIFPDCRSLPPSWSVARSGASSDSGSSSAGGYSTVATALRSGRAGTTARAAADLSWICIRTGATSSRRS